MPGSIVKKTDFWIRNSLKSPEIAVCTDFYLTFPLFLHFFSPYTILILPFSISILYLSLGRSNMQCACLILGYEYLRLIWAKRVIWGRSVKYTILAGGKNWPHTPKIYVKSSCLVKFEQKKCKKVRGGSHFSAFSKDDDVIRQKWRHQSCRNFNQRCQFIFCPH